MLIKFKENIKLGGNMNTSENKRRSSLESPRLKEKAENNKVKF